MSSRQDSQVVIYFQHLKLPCSGVCIRHRERTVGQEAVQLSGGLLDHGGLGPQRHAHRWQQQVGPLLCLIVCLPS